MLLDREVLLILDIPNLKDTLTLKEVKRRLDLPSREKKGLVERHFL